MDYSTDYIGLCIWGVILLTLISVGFALMCDPYFFENPKCRRQSKSKRKRVI